MIDKASYLKMIDQKKFNFKENFPVELQEDYDVIVALQKKDDPPFEWVDLSEKAKLIPQIVCYFLKINRVQYIDLPEEMKNDDSVVKTAISNNIRTFGLLNERLRNDPEIAFYTVKQSSAYIYPIYQFLLSDTIKRDPKMIDLALNSNINSFCFFPNDMQNDPKIIDRIVEKGIKAKHFKLLSEKYRNDEAFILKAIKSDADCFEYIAESFKSNEVFVEKALKKDGNIFKWIAEPLKAKKELVLLAINNIHGRAKTLYEQMADDLKQDKQLIKLFLKKDDDIFEILDDKFKNDMELIQMLLPKDRTDSARIYAQLTPQYQQSYELALKIVKGFGFPLEHAPLEWRKKPDFVRLAIISDIKNYEYIDETLKSDFKFIEELYWANPKIEEYLDEPNLERLRPRVFSPIHYSQQVEVIREKDIDSMTTFAKSVKVFKNQQLILQFDQMPIAEYEENGPCGSYTALRAIQYLLLVGEFIFFVRQNTGVETNQMHTGGNYLFAPRAQTNTKFLNHHVYLIDPTKCKNFKDLKSAAYEMYFASLDKYLPKGVTCYQSPQEYHDVWNILYNPLRTKADYVLINRYALQVKKNSPVNEIYGAAYVYLTDFGWRFLIPNALGTHEALEKLIYSNLSDDWQWIQSQAKPLTKYQVDLLYRAFKTESFFADVEKYSKQYYQE